MAGQDERQPTEPQSLNDIVALLGDIDEAETEESSGEDEVEEQGEELSEEEQETDEEEESESEESTFTIKHDDKEVTLKQSELLELAQKGFDYTKKTMAVAEERKALEPVKAEWAEKIQYQEKALDETLQRLNTVAHFIEQELGEPPSIGLAHHDAAQYLAQKEAYESRVAKLRNTYGQIQSLDQEKNQLRQSQLLEQANETEKYLVEKLPGWKDAPEKSLQELNAYIKSYGLSPETTREAYVQHGLWEIAHKAREYDALMQRKSELKPKAVIPKVTRPSTNPAPVNVRQAEAMKQYKARPSLSSASALLPDF